MPGSGSLLKIQTGRKSGGYKAGVPESAKNASRRENSLEMSRTNGSYSPMEASHDDSGSDDDSSSGHELSIEDLKAQEKDQFDLTLDVWSVAIFSILKDWSLIISAKEGISADGLNYLRFALSMTALAINLCMQVALVRWVDEYIVQNSVEEIQEGYKAFHREIFSPTGIFQEDKWDDWDGKSKICETGFSRPAFMSAIIGIWCFRMLAEMREIDTIRKHINTLPALPDGAHVSDMVVTEWKEDVGQNTHEIICIDRGSKFTMYIIIVVPRVFIGLFLLYYGCRFLLSTVHFHNIVLNVLALEFVVCVDELFFTSLFPESLAENVTNTKIAVARIHDKQQARKNEKSDVTKSLLTILLVVLMVAFYMLCGQQVIPGFEQDTIGHCADYLNRIDEPPCQVFTLWPFTSNECFPYPTYEEMEADQAEEAEEVLQKERMKSKARGAKGRR
eukprot:gnl/TRDRNA2_/TRDRNA2_201299_c0_seq1.p1 gnl/TRDRNA2_/TRDRNA2_201299_c0~~gnl/TRDRNA2_/TRDRNA2_201299_c0_seq1.p1  ORF type:complete len:447 (+),score=66.14 gnl/TRDRNA2_/TRDRNA2_201299_c0_seq1:30-1370(+)